MIWATKLKVSPLFIISNYCSYTLRTIVTRARFASPASFKLCLRKSKSHHVCVEVSDTIPDKETTDVAQLWQKALDQWQLQTAEFKNKLAKEDVERLEKVKTADDIVTYIAATTNKFIYWRHPRTKLDDFRSVVSNNLGYIQALGQVVADAASAVRKHLRVAFVV